MRKQLVEGFFNGNITGINKPTPIIGKKEIFIDNIKSEWKKIKNSGFYTGDDEIVKDICEFIRQVYQTTTMYVLFPDYSYHMKWDIRLPKSMMHFDACDPDFDLGLCYISPYKGDVSYLCGEIMADRYYQEHCGAVLDEDDIIEFDISNSTDFRKFTDLLGSQVEEQGCGDIAFILNAKDFINEYLDEFAEQFV